MSQLFKNFAVNFAHIITAHLPRNNETQGTASYRWHPAKRALPAMLTHGRYALLAGYPRYVVELFIKA